MPLIPEYTARQESPGKYIIDLGNDRYFKVSAQAEIIMASLVCSDNFSDAYQVFCSRTDVRLDEKVFLERAKNIIDKFSAARSVNYISMRTTLLSPHAIGKFSNFLRPLFLPRMAISLLLVLIIIAWWRTGFSITTVHGAKPSATILIAILFFDVILHELGHLTACRHFGGRHGELGFGFYLMFPVAYADVTGVWMLNKMQRVVVNLSGIYFELVFVLLLLVFQKEMGATSAAAAMAITGKLIYTLIPFLRSDGYWVLCDLIGMHDLLARAHKTMKELFGALLRFRFPAEVFSQPQGLAVFFYGVINSGFLPIFLLGVLKGHFQLVVDFPGLLLSEVGNFVKYGQMHMVWTPSILMVLAFYVTIFRVCMPKIKDVLGKLAT